MWMWRTDAGEVPSGVRHLEFSSGSERLLAITYAFYMYKYINSRLDVLSEKRKPAGNRPGVSGCSAGVLLILRWCGFLTDFAWNHYRFYGFIIYVFCGNGKKYIV